MIIALVIPAVGSYWVSPIYLIICGFALLPMFVLLIPRPFNRIIKEHKLALYNKKSQYVF
jgi:hypothetical protein